MANERPSLLADPVGWLREGAEQTAARTGKDEFGNQKDPGWMNNLVGSLTGATDEGTDYYRGALKTTALGKKYNTDLGVLGLEDVKPGESEGSVLSRIRGGRIKQERDAANWMTDAEKRLLGLKESQHNAEIQALTGKLDIARQELGLKGQELNATIKQNTDKLNWDKEKYGSELQLLEKQGNQERADKALDRAHDIELLDMKQGAEMDAYKHNMGIYERESQRNRTAALVSGIASLGAMLAI